MGLVLDDNLRASLKAQLTASPKHAVNPKRTYYRYNGGRAHISDALGVGADQVDEYRKHLREHGIMADVLPDGRVKIESEKQFRDIARAGGLFSGRDGFGARDSEGNKIMTGREQGQGRQRLKEFLRKECAGYPVDFNGPLTRSNH